MLGGALLLAGSWVIVAAHDHVPAFEVRVFEAMNGLPGSIWPFVWVPMQVGSFVVSLLAAVVTFVVSRDWRLSTATLLAGQVAFWGAKCVKRVVLRARPNVLLTDVHLHERASGLGYVSGHIGGGVRAGAVLAPSLPRRGDPSPSRAASSSPSPVSMVAPICPSTLSAEPGSACSSARCRGGRSASAGRVVEAGSVTAARRRLARADRCR